jgi:hypothetical protein
VDFVDGLEFAGVGDGGEFAGREVVPMTPFLGEGFVIEGVGGLREGPKVIYDGLAPVNDGS